MENKYEAIVTVVLNQKWEAFVALLTQFLDTIYRQRWVYVFTSFDIVVTWCDIQTSTEGRQFSCFQGVWCVFLVLWASPWPCWWSLQWQTPASVLASEPEQWWVHPLPSWQHSCICKTLTSFPSQTFLNQTWLIHLMSRSPSVGINGNTVIS